MKNNFNTYLVTKDYLVSGETFKLLSDKNRDFLITSPAPEDEKLPLYYKSENYISHTDSNNGLFEKIYHMVKKITIAKKTHLIQKENKSTGKLLDVGAGTGDFLLNAKNKNWQVFGVEPNEEARNLSQKKGVVLKERLEDISAYDFDVITLWHVLEHLPNLDHDIQQLFSKLKKGGTLIIAVPNFKSYDAQYYKTHWAAFDVPRHLWHFSKTSVKRIFEKHGLAYKKFKPMLFDSYYVSLLSEKNKTGKRNWIKAFLIGTLSNGYGLLKKEYSSHIYILKKQ